MTEEEKLAFFKEAVTVWSQDNQYRLSKKDREELIDGLWNSKLRSQAEPSADTVYERLDEMYSLILRDKKKGKK
ncbi:MAG: hypothetical protein KF802_02910 [Bdellovibrionaceae bacterium]|nr:hypothetical protein [Pseudobdellovibrionaceae bacterium]